MHDLDSSTRKAVLDAAAQAVLQDRNAAYGSVENNFQDIANVWMWFLGERVHKITPIDVAHMMILMKMARLKYNPNHRDSKVDVAGYAACAAECETRTASAHLASLTALKNQIDKANQIDRTQNLREERKLYDPAKQDHTLEVNVPTPKYPYVEDNSPVPTYDWSEVIRST